MLLWVNTLNDGDDDDNVNNADVNDDVDDDFFNPHTIAIRHSLTLVAPISCRQLCTAAMLVCVMKNRALRSRARIG